MGLWICSICLTWSILMINCSAVNLHTSLWKRGTEGVWPCGAQTLWRWWSYLAKWWWNRLSGSIRWTAKIVLLIWEEISKDTFWLFSICFKKFIISDWTDDSGRRISLTTQLSETVTVKNSISVINNLPVMQQTYGYLYISSSLFISYEKLDEWHSKPASKSY